MARDASRVTFPDSEWPAGATTLEEWRSVFRRLGAGRTQAVSLKRLSQFIQQPHVSRHLPPTAVESLARRAQTQPNSELTFGEFLQLVAAPSTTKTAGGGGSDWLTRAAYTVIPTSQRTAAYHRQYNCRPPPVLILLVCSAQLATAVYRAVTTSASPLAESPLIYNPHRRRQLWRLLTYTLVHSGWPHLLLNLATQLIVGLPLELVHKWPRLAALYLGSAVLAALSVAAVDPHVFLAGASGPVYALLSAHAASLLLNWAEMELALLRLSVLLLLSVVDITVAIYQRYSQNTSRGVLSDTGYQYSQQTVAYSAHLAGAVAGLLLGNLLLKNLRPRRWENILWWVSLIGLTLMTSTVVAVNLLMPPGYYPKQYD